MSCAHTHTHIVYIRHVIWLCWLVASFLGYKLPPCGLHSRTKGRSLCVCSNWTQQLLCGHLICNHKWINVWQTLTVETLSLRPPSCCLYPQLVLCAAFVWLVVTKKLLVVDFCTVCINLRRTRLAFLMRSRCASLPTAVTDQQSETLPELKTSYVCFLREIKHFLSAGVSAPPG